VLRRGEHVPLGQVVAFTGKVHYAALFDPPLARVEQFGPQTRHPPGWPFPAPSEIWVLASPSGRAAMTAATREEPYRRLAARLAALPLPGVQPRLPGPGHSPPRDVAPGGCATKTDVRATSTAGP